MPRANVLDMFHGDNQERTPDFAALKRDGIIAVFHKATQGTRYIDPRFAARRKAAALAGMPFGAYHFGDASDEKAQLGHFISVAGPIGGIQLALDFEKNGDSTMALHQARWFLTQLYILSGQRPWLYSGDLIRETLTPVIIGHQHPDMVDSSDFFAACRLWLAEYGPVEKVPFPWKKADLWQFSESGTIAGIAGRVDLNYYDGATFP
jgi:lysozyme